MKLYITRRGQPDFVVECDSIADGIVRYWFATGATPKPTYRVHFGRRRTSRVVSSAICYWYLAAAMRGPLYAVLEETTSESQFSEFCETAIEAANLLGK